jgi:hypothetical protein
MEYEEKNPQTIKRPRINTDEHGIDAWQALFFRVYPWPRILRAVRRIGPMVVRRDLARRSRNQVPNTGMAKKIYGKKMARAAWKTLAHFSASDFFAIRFSNITF